MAEDRRREAGALKVLSAAPEAADLPAPTAVLLGRALADSGEAEAAVALLRPAAVRHPGDVWVNSNLAWALERQGSTDLEEAVRYFTAARALRPETAHELAHLLERMGRGTEAEAVFRDLTDRRPENAPISRAWQSTRRTTAGPRKRQRSSSGPSPPLARPSGFTVTISRPTTPSVSACTR